MADDPAFHFTPDVFEALVTAIPVLVRGKRDVLTFFQGCGVNVTYLAKLESWAAKGSNKTKYHIAREVLTHVNAQGDPGLAARRQLIKRVTEFESFSGCWPDDQLKARGAVANVAELVNKKDSFTRMQQERERALREHSDAKRAELDRVAVAKSARAQVKAELFRLFGMSDPQERGTALEGVLNRLFQTGDMLVREAFVVRNDDGKVVEQVDGGVDIDGRLYLVEMKWWNQRLGRADVAPHLVSVYSRAEAGGIIISSSGFHESAVSDCKDALSQHVIILVELREIVTALEQEVTLLDLFRLKIREATMSKRPLSYPLG